MAGVGGDAPETPIGRMVWLLGRVRGRVLWLAPGFALALAAAVSLGGLRPGKPLLEALALLVTGAAAAVCALRFALSRDAFFLWGAAVMVVVLAREIRFEGASTGVYVALALLAGIALHRFPALRHRLADPGLLTALALGGVAYALSVAVDQRWLRALPGESQWHVPVEESLELLGHLVIGVALAWAPRRGGAAGLSSRE